MENLNNEATQTEQAEQASAQQAPMIDLLLDGLRQEVQRMRADMAASSELLAIAAKKLGGSIVISEEDFKSIVGGQLYNGRLPSGEFYLSFVSPEAVAAAEAFKAANDQGDAAPAEQVTENAVTE